MFTLKFIEKYPTCKYIKKIFNKALDLRINKTQTSATSVYINIAFYFRDFVAHGLYNEVRPALCALKLKMMVNINEFKVIY